MKRMVVRRLQWLALAIVAIVCAGLAGPAPHIAKLAPSIEVTARDESASVVRRPSAPRWSHYWQAGAVRPVVDLEALASDIDDGDVLYGVADGVSAGFESVSFPREPAGTLRCQPRVDTSRFALGTGLPRGPPTT
jgi:hypothetical protein